MPSTKSDAPEESAGPPAADETSTAETNTTDGDGTGVALPDSWAGTTLATPGLPVTGDASRGLVMTQTLYSGTTSATAQEIPTLGEPIAALEYDGQQYTVTCETGTEVGGAPATCTGLGEGEGGVTIDVEASIVPSLHEHTLLVVRVLGSDGDMPAPMSFPDDVPVVAWSAQRDDIEPADLTDADAVHALENALLMSDHPDGDPSFSVEAECGLDTDHRFTTCTVTQDGAEDPRVAGTWIGSVHPFYDGGIELLFGRVS